MFFLFSLCGGMEEAGACHNALLVYSGQAEPGSASVTQLLAAIVLTLGLSAASESGARLPHMPSIYNVTV